MADPTPTQIPSEAAATTPAPASQTSPESLPLARPWWRAAPALHGLIAGLVSFVCLQAAFVVHVHHDYEGKYHAPFLPAYFFGLPKLELDQGQRPVCGGKECGWDGQFYYHMSHDPFARDIDSFAKHIDTPTYRYQRIGVPLMAWAAARITGRTFTSAFIYHTVQIALTAFGFGVLVGWLSSVGLAWGWSLCWLLGGGVLFSLFKGLPDAPSDAMFIAALAALYYRRLGWYSLFASLACMIREGYVVVAFIVFLATIVNRYSWNGSPGLIRRAFLTALPGILVVGWMAYISFVFSKSPASDRGPGLYRAPFEAFLACLSTARMRGNISEIRWSLVSVSMVVAVLASGVLSARRSLVAVCGVVYALLIASLGEIIWEDFCGHAKAITGVAVFGIMLLKIDPSSFRRGAVQLALLANLFVGLERNVIIPIAAPFGYNEISAAQRQIASLNPPTGDQSPTDSDCRSKVVWINATSDYDVAVPWYLRKVHREQMPLTIDVVNESSVPWIGNRTGENAVRVGIQLLDGERIVCETRGDLPRDVMPGETVRVSTGILVRRPGQYVLRIGLLQEGRHWFKDLGQTDVLAPLVVR